MPPPRSANALVSRTVFVSQLAAIGLYGLAAAIESIVAGEVTLAALLIVGVVGISLGVVGFRLPAFFAERMSLGALSTMAILISLLALGLFYTDAARYFNLSTDLAVIPGMGALRLVSYIGLAGFALAFVATAAAVAVAARRQ